jgi:tRNA-splicing ligase RtcB
VQVIQGSKGGLIKGWFDGVSVEDAAMVQLNNVASMPFIHRHVAGMPDAHWGNGTTVGSVIPTKGAIIPAAVGVDIGCGMIAQRTSLTAADLPDNLLGLRTAIEQRIPHGRIENGDYKVDKGAWGVPGVPAVHAFMGRGEFASPNPCLHTKLQKLTDKHTKLARGTASAAHHLGTLGGGNHFVEVCLDEEDRVWIMLHSGSRGMGNAIGRYFIEKAKEDMRRYFINLPDQDLAYLVQGSEVFDDYWGALNLAQRFAKTNRDLMMTAAMEALSVTVPKMFTCEDEAVNCHHNYCSHEHHFGSDVIVTRKGAVRVTPDTLGIIPGSMGAKSFIVRGLKGKALAESFDSASHGAGRAMSRTEARRRFSLADHIAATATVECRKDDEVIDETPAAYKDIDAVMAAQTDHVETVHTLRQVVCVKG